MKVSFCFFVHFTVNFILSISRTNSLRHIAKPSRFLQRGFFDAYDRSGERLFDSFIHGYCSTFSPPYQKKIGLDWIQIQGWSYESSNVIGFKGSGEPQHIPFWLWFWKKRRYWLKNALIKKDYFCQTSEILAEVKLSGASEAGIIFRARGTFDFWALLLTRNKVVLVWFKEGRRQELKTCEAPKKEWILLKVSDQISDVVMWCGDGELVQQVTRPLNSIEEIADQHIGAAGLVAFGGGAEFRNVHFGPVDWDTTQKVSNPKIKKSKTLRSPEKEAIDNLEDMDLSDLLDQLTQWCPNPSLCATPPFRLLDTHKTRINIF